MGNLPQSYEKIEGVDATPKCCLKKQNKKTHFLFSRPLQNEQFSEKKFKLSLFFGPPYCTFSILNLNNVSTEYLRLNMTKCYNWKIHQFLNLNYYEQVACILRWICGLDCGFVNLCVYAKTYSAPRAFGAWNLKDKHWKYPFDLPETLAAKFFECEILDSTNSRNLWSTLHSFHIDKLCLERVVSTISKGLRKVLL